MRRLVFRIAADREEEAMRALLPLLPRGLHVVRHGDETELVALAEPRDLSPLDDLVAAAGDLLLAAPADDEAGDLAAEISRLRPRHEIAGRVVLRPVEGEPPSDRGVVDVTLEHSVGFGTGAHPTTRLVIELLTEMEPGGSFVDVGCGIGAVTITAGKLGWSPVRGVDYDRPALENAARNAETNGVDADFAFVDLKTDELELAETTAVNISDLPLQRRVATMTGAVQRLIVSGFLIGDDLDQALEAYRREGFAERDRRLSDRWVATLLARS
jgi:ribosomal protein L11 methyltransferase